ncbi:MAG: PDZ domain-containing protein [Fibrobacterales bacterium]
MMFQYFFLCLLFVVTTVHTQTTHSKQVPSIAVLQFESSSIDSSQSEIITSLIESELIKTKMFKILERQQMNKILGEQGFQSSGACNSTDCQIELGQLLGVDQICTGSIGKVGNTFILTAKLIDIQTSTITKSGNATTKGYIDDLISESIPKVVAQITSTSTQSNSKATDNSLAGIGKELGKTLIHSLKGSEKDQPKSQEKGIIGIRYRPFKSFFKIKLVSPSTPAYYADILKNDIIISIDNESIEGYTTNKVKRMLSGYKDEAITLGLIRKKHPVNDTIAITLIRK